MKIGYLVDRGSHWGEDPDWRFYSEKELPDYISSYDTVKRIVYFEVDEE